MDHRKIRQSANVDLLRFFGQVDLFIKNFQPALKIDFGNFCLLIYKVGGVEFPLTGVEMRA